MERICGLLSGKVQERVNIEEKFNNSIMSKSCVDNGDQGLRTADKIGRIYRVKIKTNLAVEVPRFLGILWAAGST